MGGRHAGGPDDEGAAELGDDVQPSLGTDTVSGPNADSSWRLTNSGTGSLTGGVGTLNFSKVEHLTGGAGRDTFKFERIVKEECQT